MIKKITKNIIIMLVFALSLYGEVERKKADSIEEIIKTSINENINKTKEKKVEQKKVETPKIEKKEEREVISNNKNIESNQNIQNTQTVENIKKEVEPKPTKVKENTSKKVVAPKNNVVKSVKKADIKSKNVVVAIDKDKEENSHYNNNTKKIMQYIATADGKVIKNVFDKEKHPIASLTKVMNILVALDEIDKGNANLDDKVCFTPETVNIRGSWLNVNSGDCFLLRDLLRAEIIYSANNAAYLVATHIGKGNIDNFVQLMNKKAKELGMNDTEFNSPAGLPSYITKKKMDISTAYDMYLLGVAAIKDSRIREWGSEKELVLENAYGVQTLYKSRNKLLGKHGIYGLKTGFHFKAGFNIIVASKIGNLEIISVSLGSSTSKEREQLQNTEFLQIEKNLKKVYSNGQNMGEFTIKNAKKKKVLGILEEDIYQLNDTNYEFKIVDLKGKIKKELKVGDVIGEVEVLSGDKVVSKVKILSTENVKELSFFEKILRFISFGLI